MSDQQKELSPFASLKMKMEGGLKPELAKMLGSSCDVDRFIRVALTAVQRNEDLLYADRKSLIFSCMSAAQDGLLPDGREAVLNVYNTKQNVPHPSRPGMTVEEWVPTVQYLPMVRGIIKIMRSSGEVLTVDAAAVYDKDVFSFRRGDDPKIEHEPYLGDDDPGEVIAAYVIVKLANGEVHREVMPRRDIEKVRNQSKTGNGKNSPWVKWYDQMAIKSVIKRAAKLLPNIPEALERALQNDNDAMGFDFDTREQSAPTVPAQAQQAPQAEHQQASPALRDERPEQEQRRPSRLAGIMNKARQAETVPAGSDATPPWEERAA